MGGPRGNEVGRKTYGIHSKVESSRIYAITITATLKIIIMIIIMTTTLTVTK